MPNRIIKESIRTSETINSLTAEEEVFFYRLLTACDDYGCFDGRASILRSALYPLRVDDVTEDMVERWLERLVEVGLVTLYEVAGHRYLHVQTWAEHQRVRQAKRRYPEPPADDSVGPAETRHNSPQLAATRRRSPPESESESESRSESESESSSEMMTHDDEDGTDWIRWYEKRTAAPPSQREMREAAALIERGVTDELIIEAIKRAIEEKARQPVTYALRIIANMQPYGVRTVEDWRRHEAEPPARASPKKGEPKGFDAIMELIGESETA